MDIRKIPKENSYKEDKEEDIEALEFMKASLSLWDKYDSLNMKDSDHDDAQRNRTSRKSSKTLRS